MRIKLLNRFWRLIFTKLSKDDGYCTDPSKPNRQILIDSRLQGQRELEIILHEMLHAVDWHKDEDTFIQPVAADFARALWRLGYRRQ